MQKLSAFSMVSVDGYFVGENGDMTWTHGGKREVDEEWREFVRGNAAGDGTLLFGRVTYEMMASWWPTERGRASEPVVAAGMNARPKVVVSRTLEQVAWENSRVLKGDLVEGVRRLKAEEGKGITILGSGSIIGQLTRAGLIDEYQVVVMPVALGKGRTVFEGIDRLALRLVKVRGFGKGNVVMGYGLVK